MRRLGKGIIGLFRGQKGFTLIESLVAVAILAAIGVVFMTALSTNYKATNILDEQVTATNLATAYLEAIRELPYSDNYSSAGNNIVLPSQYLVDIKLFYSADGTTWVSSYSGQKLQKVVIVVLREGGEPVFSICTYRTQR